MGVVLIGVGVLVLAWAVGSALRFLAPGRHGLAAGEVRVWRAYFGALLATAPWGHRVPIDALLADLGAMLALAPVSARWPLYLIAGLFDRLPLGLGMSLRRFSALPADRGVAVLRCASASRTFLIAAVFEAVQTPGLVIIGGHPEVLKICGVSRGEQVTACRAARERALGGTP